MFEIKPAYSKSPTRNKLMVIDEDRDVWLQRIGGMGSEPGTVFKLVWKGQEIAFEVFPNPQKDENGEEYIIQRFGGFGHEPYRHQGSFPRWKAETPEQRQQAMLLAVEALLAYGSFCSPSAIIRQICCFA